MQRLIVGLDLFLPFYVISMLRRILNFDPILQGGESELS